jgi:hypothetical protein
MPSVEVVDLEAVLRLDPMSTSWIAQNLPHLRACRFRWRDRLGLNREFKLLRPFFAHLVCASLVLERPEGPHGK